jgi:tetratricopeptide (TPR) repeat protein
MKKVHAVSVVLAFAGGIVIGYAASVPRSVPALFTGKAPREAASALLETAHGQAEDGSWENIAVARVYYLMGEKQKAGEILDHVLAGKLKGNDWIRIGRLYAEAGEWPKAKEAFDKAIVLEPKDAEYAAEVGAYYNLNGDRARAEELFARSFARKGDNVWNTLNVAGSYVGVRPQ